MKIIIQKFGGTSLSTHERRIMAVEKVSAAILEGFSPVVVVSAMGRIGDFYATDTLLSLVNENLKKKAPYAVDLLLSCGETISTVIMCNELLNKDIVSYPLMGGQAGIITDCKFNEADIQKVDTERILKLIKENKVPVIAGFQGMNEEGYITTLGRGGSDVTASLLGVALKAEKIEIYTDVDGIMTADPRIVSEASLIEEMNYNEVFQFADQGAKVIHPRAVSIAMMENVPLIVKNTFSDKQGTLIHNNKVTRKVVTGITHISKRVQVKVTHSTVDDSLLDNLAIGNISIDLINIFPKDKVFTIDEDDLENFKVIMENTKESYTYIDNCCKIAIIGSGMKGIPGVMARIFRALNAENIEILQSSDSYTTIWVLTRNVDVKRAINSLHKIFELG
ncbi:MAG TPA: aspartate kinase [Clostridiaceae bacterium]